VRADRFRLTFRIVRHDVPHRLVYWSGWVVGGLTLAWTFTQMSGLGKACAVVGVGYSLISLLRPELMPRVRTELVPQVTERVALLSNRVLGCATLPLWALAWINRPPSIPSAVLIPVAIGFAVGVLAQVVHPD
jgi:hypothetical protein